MTRDETIKKHNIAEATFDVDETIRVKDEAEARLATFPVTVDAGKAYGRR